MNGVMHRDLGFEVYLVNSGMVVARKAAPIRAQVLAYLRDAILSGRFQPGRRLIERELCALMDVSRTTIREALRQLESEGLVEIVPNKGPVVVSVTAADARDIYEAREVLEGLAGRLFAQRASEEAIEQLGEAVSELEVAYSEGDPQRLLDEKNRFYELLLRYCENKVVYSFLRSLHARVTFLRATSMSEPGRPKQSLEEILAILAAIRDRDASAAEEACVDHIRQAAKVALAVLESEPDGFASKGE